MNEKLVKVKDVYCLLNEERGEAKVLQLTNDLEALEVEAKYYVYLVNEENKKGKAVYFESLNECSYFYNKTVFEMNYSYIEQGLELVNDIGAYKLRCAKLNCTH